MRHVLLNNYQHKMMILDNKRIIRWIYFFPLDVFDQLEENQAAEQSSDFKEVLATIKAWASEFGFQSKRQVWLMDGIVASSCWDRLQWNRWTSVTSIELSKIAYIHFQSQAWIKSAGACEDDVELNALKKFSIASW